MEIYKKLDIDDLINVCHTDKYATRLCSKREVWNHLYVKYKLPQPSIEYKTMNDQLTAFTIAFMENPKKSGISNSLYLSQMAIGSVIYFEMLSKQDFSIM